MKEKYINISNDELYLIAKSTNESVEYYNFRKKLKNNFNSRNISFEDKKTKNLKLDFNIKNFVYDKCSKKDYKKLFSFNKDDLVIIQKNNKIEYFNIPEKYKDKIIINNIFQSLNEKKIKNFSEISLLNDIYKYLHYIFINSGIYIEVLENCEIDIPMKYYVFIEDNFSLYNHVFLKLNKNSKLNFIENYISSFSDKPFNIITEAITEENSHLLYDSVSNIKNKEYGYISHFGKTLTNSTIDWNIVAIDESNIYYDNDTKIKGKNSTSNINVVTIGAKNKQHYFNTELTNIGEKTSGNILQRGILLEYSDITFNGVGIIIKGAHDSKSFQSLKLMSLSKNAKAKTNPILLIDENDVKAGHGASIGKINEEQIYYLNSRGISTKDANFLLSSGFIFEIIHKIKNKEIKEYIIENIKKIIRKSEF